MNLIHQPYWSDPARQTKGIAKRKYTHTAIEFCRDTVCDAENLLSAVLSFALSIDAGHDRC